MIPAYKVSPEDTLEVAYSISQVGPDVANSEIEDFTGFSSRKVTECIRLLKEFSMIEEENERYTIDPSYRKKIDEVNIEDRDALLNRAMIQYRPFRTFASYVRKGYSTQNAAEKTNVIHEIASDAENIIDYFDRFGTYAGLVGNAEDSIEIKVEGKELPGDSVASVEELRNALGSEAEIRFWLEDTVSPEIIAGIDPDTEEEIVKAFSEHATSPRDSITASGRALEDFLRQQARDQGISPQEVQSASGTAQVANLLRNHSIIRGVHTKRAISLAAIRNKGGAHGDDQQSGKRWRSDAEIALTVAMETTLLLASVSQYIENGNQIL